MATIDEIKQLRDETGVSIMQCKKALEEAGGDIEKAKVVLRKISATTAAKKSDRELGAGAVQAYIHAGNQVGAMVVLACETDFVSKNEEFVKLAYEIALHAAAMAPSFISKDDVTPEDTKAAREVFAAEVADKPAEMQEKILAGKLESYLAEKVLLDQPFVKDPTMTIGQMVEQATQKFGEKIAVVRCERFTV
ncbi:MAG TPA: elongation factor Ts [Candidatus Paceibacterota bacterium]|nr:elongation factor Ts [Candidatus Paceibacterota bacterium]